MEEISPKPTTRSLTSTIGIIIITLLAAVIIGALVSVLFALAIGENPLELQNFTSNYDTIASRTKVRLFLMVNHLTTFILPALFIAWFLSNRQPKSYLQLDARPQMSNLALGILFVLIAYPFVQKSYEWNGLIPLPDWMIQMESSTNDSIRGMLQMKSPFEFLMNLLVIAIIPGIGEELLFRGVFQKELYKAVKRPAVAVWIAAFLFSAMHLQFQGFFPRLFLGALLGYLYLFTKNLWIPILVHFVNNAIPIVGSYLFAVDLADLGVEEAQHMPTIVAIGSLLLTIGLGLHLFQRNKMPSHEPL